MVSLSLWACRLAFVLALARLPFGLLPYVGKITLYSLSPGWLEGHWHAYPMQAVRALGDLLNWALTSALLLKPGPKITVQSGLRGGGHPPGDGEGRDGAQCGMAVGATP